MRFLQTGAVLFLSIVLMACGTDNTSETDNQDVNLTENTEEILDDAEQNKDETKEDSSNGTKDNTEDQAAAETPYGFLEFNLEANLEGYNDDEALDVEYEYETDEIEASYHDRLNDINLSGEDALTELDRVFSSFSFDENTPEDDILDEVLEEFNVLDEASEVELEIEFENGTELEYNRH